MRDLGKLVGKGPTLKEGVLRCSFCNKAQEEVAHLIAGPEVYICDECVGVCQDIIDKLQCSLCGTLTPLMNALHVENRGLLCPKCLEAVQAAALARTERHPK